jgi:hypothetical protein
VRRQDVLRVAHSSRTAEGTWRKKKKLACPMRALPHEHSLRIAQQITL